MWTRYESDALSIVCTVYTSVFGVIERSDHPISPCLQECALLDPRIGAAFAIDWVIK